MILHLSWNWILPYDKRMSSLLRISLLLIPFKDKTTFSMFDIRTIENYSNIFEALRSRCVQKFVLFSWDYKRNLFCGDEYFLSSQDDESTFLGSKMFKISPVTEAFLKKWIREDDTMEAWLFAVAKVENRNQRVIIHAIKIKDESQGNLMIAVIDMDPSIGHDYSYLLIDRASQNITFYSSDGRVHCDHIDALSYDEKLSFYHSMEGRTLREIADLCCWSYSKSKKLRLSILEKFHSTNFAQAVKLNEIFNLYCVRRGLLL